MKLYALFAAMLVALCLTSCFSDRGKAADAILAEHSDALSVSRYSESLIDRLYNEQVEKRADLKTLEEDIVTQSKVRQDSLKQLNLYLNQANAYQVAAKDLANAVNDSTLKRSLQTEVAEHVKRFNNLTADVTLKIKELKQAQRDLEDYHTVLKIRVTMAVVEKYQKAHKPDVNLLNKLVKAQQELINRTKTLAGQPK